MRLLIMGNSGSGKSYQAQALAAQHRLVHLDLDTIVWEPAQIAVPRAPEQVRADLLAFVDAAMATWSRLRCPSARNWCS